MLFKTKTACAGLSASASLSFLALSLMLTQPQMAHADKDFVVPVAPPSAVFTPTPSVVPTPMTPPAINTPTLLPTDVTGTAMNTGRRGDSSDNRSGLWVARNQNLPQNGDPKNTGQGIMFHTQKGSRYTPGDLSANGLPREVSLESGSLLVSVRHPSQTAIVSIPSRGTICVGAGADAIVSLESGVLRVQNLNGRGESVRCKLDAKAPGAKGNSGVMGIAPGWELIAGSNLVDRDLHPDDGLSRRPTQVIDKGNLAICEFSLESLIAKNPLIKDLSASHSGSQEWNVLRSLSKTSAVLSQTRGIQDFIASGKEAAPGRTGNAAEKTSPVTDKQTGTIQDIRFLRLNGSHPQPGEDIAMLDPLNLPHYRSTATVVSTTTGPHGEIITEYSEGTIRTETPDYTRWEYPDGSRVEVYPNGNTTTTFSSSPVIIERSSDGTAFTRYPGPGYSQVMRAADGTVTVSLDDNTTVTTDPDGTVTIRYPDGSTRTTAPDGHTVWRDSSGSIIREASSPPTTRNIKTHTVYPDRTVTVYDDGSQVVEYTSGPNRGRKVHSYPDGRTEETYPDGRVIMRHPNGSYEQTRPPRS